MTLNNIFIVGYLGRDPKLQTTSQGTSVCKFSVATTEKRKNSAGQPEDRTSWFNVTAWGRQAEIANDRLVKGSLAYINGRLNIEEYTDRNGQKRISAEVTAIEVRYLGGASTRQEFGEAEDFMSSDECEGDRR